MRIAAHVIEDLLGSGERPLGIHDPLASFHSIQKLNEGVPFAKGFQGVEEL
jgi:hypothetical protein